MSSMTVDVHVRSVPAYLKRSIHDNEKETGDCYINLCGDGFSYGIPPE
ncbi:MAG TPA: hypothetical protein VN368_02220 [Candidatus Methylomirabilis sp.]|nr:hypothetical protein [Candidatus Methylomirabilis sp.]